MEKIFALLLLAYAVALLVGEQLRDALFGEAETSSQVEGKKKGNGKANGGVIQSPLCSKEVRAAAIKQALEIFAAIVLPAVPTHVLTSEVVLAFFY